MYNTLSNLDVSGKTVLVRVDFNVPVENGVVTDDSRLQASVPTINFLLEKHCKILLMSHFGRPQKLLKKGESPDEVKKQSTLKPVAAELSEILGVDVAFVDDCITGDIPDADICLLENVRLYAEEEKNDPEFAKKLAEKAEAYVCDAFGSMHRDHASVTGVTKHLPSAAGLLVEKELSNLAKLLEPQRPFVAIIAGLKSDKIGALRVLAQEADHILTGGVLANTFLKSRNISIGTSRFSDDMIDLAKEITEIAGDKLHVPTDCLVADKFAADAETTIVSADSIPDDRMALDIGTETTTTYNDILSSAKTVLWAGPIGVFEMSVFSKGTEAIAQTLANADATVIAGGGDTTAAVNKFGIADKITFVSTGGGATLEYIHTKGKLPGVVALEAASSKE